jgi:hypothetical protein
LDGMYAIGIVVNFSKLAYKLFNDYGWTSFSSLNLCAQLLQSGFFLHLEYIFSTPAVSFNSALAFTFCLHRDWWWIRGESLGSFWVIFEHGHSPAYAHVTWDSMNMSSLFIPYGQSFLVAF